jgi:hypothetical protein
MKSIRIILALIVIGGTLSAQTKNKPKAKARVEEKRLIQFSGVVVENDSLRPVPNTSIFARGTYHGTVTDFFGYFSFVAQTGDTIEFSALGFHKHAYIIPDTLTASKYSLIQMLRKDTLTLNAVFIYPWPTKEQFVEAFIHNPVPDDDLDRARRNLDAEQMAVRAQSMPNDGSMNYKTSMQQRYSRLYWMGGTTPPITVLNPIAWYQFVQAWKRGDYKNQNKKQTAPSTDPGLDK